MVALTQRDLPYLVLTYDPNLEAYRTDRVANVKPVCPEDSTGDVDLRPDLATTPLLTIAPGELERRERRGRLRRRIAVVAVVVVGVGAFFVIRSRRRRRARAGGARGMRTARHERALARGEGRRGAGDASRSCSCSTSSCSGSWATRRRSSPGSRSRRRRRSSGCGTTTGSTSRCSASSSTTSATPRARPRDQPADAAEPVWDEIKDAIPWTLLLVGTGTLLATLIGTLDGGGGRDAARQEDRRRPARLQPVHLRRARVLDRDHPDPGLRRLDTDLPGRAAGDARGRVLRASSPTPATSPSTWCFPRPR